MIDLLPVLLVNGIIFGAIYGINAIGIGIVYNSTGIINFAQGEFAMLGGMLTYAFHGPLGLPLPLAILAAIAATTVVGLLVERIFIRPLWRRGAKAWSFVFILFAVAIILSNLAMLLIGKDPYTFDSFTKTPLHLGQVTITPQSLWVLATAALIAVLLQFFFNHTLLGKAMKATAVNRRAAGWIGVPVEAMLALSFALAALLGAVGGIVYTPMISTQFDAGISLTLKGFAAAIIGGLGNVRGALLGGIVIGVLEALGTTFVSSTYSDVVTYGLMIVLLLAWPSGIFRSMIELRHEEI